MSEFEDLLRAELAAAGERGFPLVELSGDQVSALSAHYERLARWNARMNLTAIRTMREAVRLHYCECLVFAAWMNAAAGAGILDVGSGAGFPGFVMAVLRRDWNLTLLESHARKSVFLQEAVRGLANARVMGKRVESVEGTWDWLVSRAVRVGDVMDQVPRLAVRVGLLIGEEDSRLLLAERRLEWGVPLRLPWGDHRFALFGEVQCST